jgi:fatty acid desaturase
MHSPRRLDRPTLGLLAAMYGLLLGNAALWFTAPLPLLVHVAAGAVAIHLAFTIWHEAVHRNAAGDPRLNEIVGVLGALPYMAPYHLEKWLHLQHHALLNQPDDPNRVYTDGPFWQLPLRYLRIPGFLRERMRGDPRTRGEKLADAAPPVLAAGVYGVALWQGVLLDALLLWAVPLVIAKVVMDWYINYLPHVGLPPDRYRGTRVIDVAWLTPLVLGHNYHAIHHLWPNLPWHRYRAVFAEKRAQLRERGVPIETRLAGYRHHGRDVLGHDSLPG